MHKIIYIKVVMNQLLHTCTGCRVFSSVFITQAIRPAIGTNHANILTGLRDSRLCNKLAVSRAKKWTTMSQVLQDVADMVINFNRSCGYSLPTFKVQYVSSTNSSSSYRSNKPATRNIWQPSNQQEKPKCWHYQGKHYKKDCPTAPKPSFPPKYKST